MSSQHPAPQWLSCQVLKGERESGSTAREGTTLIGRGKHLSSLSLNLFFLALLLPPHDKTHLKREMGVSPPLVLFHFTSFRIIKYPRILFSYLGVFPSTFTVGGHLSVIHLQCL